MIFEYEKIRKKFVRMMYYEIEHRWLTGKNILDSEMQTYQRYIDVKLLEVQLTVQGKTSNLYRLILTDTGLLAYEEALLRRNIEGL